ncbi:MAG: right-handed parallel beta-helix repeat-containing protein [Saprospiraceae bacterium]|nr:right-handed parallel beta-helix repeat-containing protein [Saprospiraceae bacterium]
MKRIEFIYLLCIMVGLPLCAYPQNLVVSNLLDAGPGSLRDAIQLANLRPGPDTITFLIMDADDQELSVIELDSALPKITDAQLVVLGNSSTTFENGTSVHHPGVIIAGYRILSDSAIGLHIRAESVHIANLVLDAFDGGGIVMEGANGSSVAGCYIGDTGEFGPGRQSQHEANGITISSSSNITIGPSPFSNVGNYISGYAGHGIRIEDSSAFNIIIFNQIGASNFNPGFFSPGNGSFGISITEGSHHNEMIDNLIGLNESGGVGLLDAYHNICINNQIGTDIDFRDTLANKGSGVHIDGMSQRNQIVENQIGLNHDYGIRNTGMASQGNLFRRNFISGNRTGGILNENGANQAIIPPTLDTIAGNTLSGYAGIMQIIELFLDETNQGRFYIDSTVSDIDGWFSFDVTGFGGDLNFTATATDTMNNTTAFSEPFQISATQRDLIVTHSFDSGDGSLRAAIDSANSWPGPDTIRFQIPRTDPGFDSLAGIWVIKPDTPYSFLSDEGLVIDGPSQALFDGTDANPLGPEIVINGEDEGSFGSCFVIATAGIQILDLVVQNFNGNGIDILSAGSAIISGCYIGTDHTGMEAAGNNDGVVIGFRAHDNVIGPSEHLPMGNIISGNNRIGVFIVDSATNNFIIGNRIGVNRDVSDVLRNVSRGINLQGDSNEIFDNYIGGSREGIGIFGGRANVIGNNFIGTDETGSTSLGNETGIYLWLGAKQNRLLQNIIGQNEVYGIYCQGDSTIQNVFSRNNFYANTVGDIENIEGGNLELTPPTIHSVSALLVTGQGGRSEIIEIYRDDGNQTIVFLDSTTTDEAGNFNLTLQEPLDQSNALLATARDSSGNTSEFSTPLLITDTKESTVGVETGVLQSYPNPSDHSATITFDLRESIKLKLVLWDGNGNTVRELVNSFYLPGKHFYHLDTVDLVDGVYFYSIWLNDKLAETRKMVVVH